jgi:hypothetical protein
MILAANRNTLACHAVWDLTPSWSEELLEDNHHQASRELTLSLNKASTDAKSLYRFYFIIFMSLDRSIFFLFTAPHY